MTLDLVLVLDESGNTLARIIYTASYSWSWACSGGGCEGKATGDHLSASAALADFEAHVERRHP